MPATKQQRAALARGRLLGLGPNAAERAELTAAGVAQVTINSLYPGTFAALLPSLIDHLSEYASGDDISAFASVGAKLKRLLRQLPRELASELDDDYTESLGYRADLYTLHGYLAERLGQPAKVEIIDRFTPQRMALDVINRSIWQIHWLTMNHSRLHVEQQVTVDKLAVRLANLAGLI